MEINSLIRCSRCLAPHEDIKITHIDEDGNLYCIKCANYLNKVGGYDLKHFNVNEFLDKFES